MQNLLKKVKSLDLGILSDKVRSNALLKIAEFLEKDIENILSANKKDVQSALENSAKNPNDPKFSTSAIARLKLDSEKVKKMAQSVREIAALRDPLNRVLDGWEMPSGIKIQKVSTPLGVIGVIYESRPNVTSDVAALCLKSGNACVLKGGSEALNSNEAILQSIHKALDSVNLPKECVSMLATHAQVEQFLKQDKFIDLLIPRGSSALINFVQENSKIPIIKHDKGVCHLYVHSSARLDWAIQIATNAKLNYPAACNAIETILIDSEIADDFLPHIAKALRAEECKIMGDDEVAQILKICGGVDGQPDFEREYGDKIVNVRVVGGLQGALEHISEFGSEHSDCIVAQDLSVAQDFLNRVKSACVYVNASTRFSDGGEFGFGAEVGISTNKLHARGPMGIDSLTTYKYKIMGFGAMRE